MKVNYTEFKKRSKDFCFQPGYRGFQQTNAPTAEVRRKTKKLQESSF